MCSHRTTTAIPFRIPSTRDWRDGLNRHEAIFWNEKPPISELWASHGLHSIFARELSKTAGGELTRPTHLPIADWANMAYCPFLFHYSYDDTMSTPAGYFFLGHARSVVKVGAAGTRQTSMVSPIMGSSRESYMHPGCLTQSPHFVWL